MSATAKGAAAAADYIDQRTGVATAVKAFARKIFPDHWSFLIGEIALFSFVILLITGTFLALFFVPSMDQVTYDGPLASMQGVEMSRAFASTLHISFEVAGGLLMRQIHHWAALVFMAAIVTHMMRVFFTGAFRKPREINWVVGFTLMVLGLAAGFSGYSLPDDVLSGNGLRITDGITRSVPVIGSYMSYFIFGGEFPGQHIIPRLFTVHILLVPGLILALVGLHLFLVVLHKHTQFPGGGRTERNVVGYPIFPVYMAKQAGFFLIIFGVLALMGATLTINPVWNYGPYDPSPVSAGAQPDWYMLFLEGALRLTPGFLEVVIAGFTIPLNIIIPAMVLPGVLLGALAAYPFIEAWATGDKREHHLADRPRNAPVRTAIGVSLLTAFVVLILAGSNDIIATHFGLSINTITWVLRIALFVLPAITFMVTKRIALGLQRKDRQLVLHGHETGKVVQLADGKFIEVHRALDEQERWVRVQHEPRRPVPLLPETNDRGVARRGYRKDALRARISQFFYGDRVEPVTPAELAAAEANGEHDALPGAQTSPEDANHPVTNTETASLPARESS